MYFVTFILKNLTRRPTRTSLTVLGLAVAVGSMILLLGISNNFSAAVLHAFERRGADLVVVPGGQADQLSGKMDEWIVERVKHMKGVKWVTSALVDFAEMWKRDPKPGEESPPSISVMVQAWPPENFTDAGTDHDLEILSGRALQPGDAGKVMLGSNLADDLNNKVGDTVHILGKPYQVIGVFKSFLVFETGAVIMPLKEYQKEVGLEGKVNGFSLGVEKGDNPDASIEAVRQQILDLKDDKGKPVRLSVGTPREYVQGASHLRLAKAMAWVVSLVALVIGVISMLNTMAMSVLERTQEIGILRAVGWTRGRIIRMVLGEAVFLGLAAAVVGAVGAVATTYILSHIPRVNGFIEGGIAPYVVLEGVALTVFIGLLGGAYPAFRAARLLPTEAIRHD